MAMTQTTEDFELFHYGVKGMKWGTRRGDAVLSRIAGRKMAGETKEEKQEFKDYKKSTSRKERKADRNEAIQERGKYLLDEALKNPTKLVVMREPSGVQALMQGKEFVAKLSSGAAFNPMDTAMTDITLEDL